ncbi:MAG: hypothetical protein ABW094_16365, partial [Candidatus Thiodiazotropha sp.]
MKLFELLDKKQAKKPVCFIITDETVHCNLLDGFLKMSAWQGILHIPATNLRGGFLLGAYAEVRSRRFDTDAVLEKILQHDKEGFTSFYE